MKIEFACTGGIANLQLHHQTHLQDLPPEQAAQLAALIEQADLPHIRAGEARAGAADAFSYSLTVEDEAHTHTVEVTDVTAPAHVRPLLDYLRNLAIQAKMKQ